MFIEVTSALTGTKVAINADHILGFTADEDGVGTAINMLELDEFRVTDSYSTICRTLGLG